MLFIVTHFYIYSFLHLLISPFTHFTITHCLYVLLYTWDCGRKRWELKSGTERERQRQKKREKRERKWEKKIQKESKRKERELKTHREREREGKRGGWGEHTVTAKVCSKLQPSPPINRVTQEKPLLYYHSPGKAFILVTCVHKKYLEYLGHLMTDTLCPGIHHAIE